MEETYGETKKKGKDAWVFHKIFKSTLTYDNNLLNTRIDPDGDLVVNVAGSVGFSRQTKGSYFETFYDLSHVHYVESEKLNAVYHVHRIRFQKNIEKLMLSFENALKPSSSVSVGDRRELDQPESESVTAVADNYAMTAQYTFSPKTSFAFAYNYDYNYLPVVSNTERVSGFSTQTHTFTPRFTYQWTPKTSLFLTASHAVADYFQSGTFSSEADYYGSGFFYKATAKTTIKFDAGYRFREYEDVRYGDTEGYIFKLQVNRRLTPKLSLSFTASTDTSLEDLDVANSTSLLQQSDFLGLNVSFEMTPFVSIDAGTGAGFNIRDGFVSQIDPENSTLSFSREIEHQIYDWHVGLNWRPKWGKLGLAYNYVNKNSSFKNFEFNKSTVVATAELKF